MCFSRPKTPAPPAPIVPEQELPEVKAPAVKKSEETKKLDKKRKGSSKLRIRRNDVGVNSSGSGLSITK